MAENPLLPDAELRRLHGLLRVAIRQETGIARKQRSARHSARQPLLPVDRAALLAASLMQLQAGDLLVTPSADILPQKLLPGAAPAASGEPALVPLAPNGATLWSAAAMAAALKALGSGGLVLAIAQVGKPDPLWAEALAWSQDQQLPLVVACADPSGAQALRPGKNANKDALHWSTLSPVARRLGLPVLTVDGSDAVASYRVMQESALRARSGGGPAVLWAILADNSGKARTTQPVAESSLARLNRYLRLRRIRLRP